ncbi:MAG: TrmB family transcriptional regulator sugar-binding domain-containing protein [Thermofilaceae archaeon]
MSDKSQPDFMNVSRVLREFFASLGLSKFSAELYWVLAVKGPMSLSDLSEELGAKPPQLHSYLKELAQVGLVEVSYGRPNVYRAVPPSVVEKLFDQRVRELKSQALALLSSSYSTEKRSEKEEFLVYVLRNWRSFLARAEEVIKEASVDLVVCGDARFVSSLSTVLEAKEEEGVNVYVLLYEVPGVPVDRESIPKVRKVKRYISGDVVAIADSRLAAVTQRRMGPYQTPSYGLIIEEPVLIDFLQHDFFNRWIRSEALRDDPVRLPTSFTFFRLALLEVEVLIRRGCRLRATVYGMHLRKGREAMIEGEVTGVVLDGATGLAQLVLNVNGERVTVGSEDAVVEDVAAYRVELRGCSGG